MEAFFHSDVMFRCQRLLALQGRTCERLARNLATLDAQLAGVGQPGLSPEHTDSSLLDRSPGTLRNALARVRSQRTPSSPVFRHAVRLSAALLTGYVLLHLVQSQEGYWVMLTTVFVCQPSFGATRQLEKILEAPPKSSNQTARPAATIGAA